MQLRLNKIPSATSNVALQRTVTLGRWIPARPGTVMSVAMVLGRTPWSSARRATSNPKLKYSGTSNRSFR